MLGIHAPGGFDLYGPLEGDEFLQFVATIHRNVALEGTLTAKQDVMDLLRQSFEAVQACFTTASGEDLERVGSVLRGADYGEKGLSPVLAHTHEHMGQANLLREVLWSQVRLGLIRSKDWTISLRISDAWIVIFVDTLAIYAILERKDCGSRIGEGLSAWPAPATATDRGAK